MLPMRSASLDEKCMAIASIQGLPELARIYVVKADHLTGVGLTSSLKGIMSYFHRISVKIV